MFGLFNWDFTWDNIQYNSGDLVPDLAFDESQVMFNTEGIFVDFSAFRGWSIKAD